MSKPFVTVLRVNDEGFFVIKATDNILDRPFTLPVREAPGMYITTIRGLALLQLDHILIDERPKP